MRQTYETRERLTVKRTAACVGLLTAVMTLVGCKQNTEAATGPEPSGVATATASPTYEATIPPTQSPTPTTEATPTTSATPTEAPTVEPTKPTDIPTTVAPSTPAASDGTIEVVGYSYTCADLSITPTCDPAIQVAMDKYGQNLDAIEHIAGGDILGTGDRTGPATIASLGLTACRVGETKEAYVSTDANAVTAAFNNFTNLPEDYLAKFWDASHSTLCPQ